MHESDSLNDPRDDAEQAFAARIRTVRPAAPRLDRDRLMYLAGRRSVERPRRAKMWPLLTVGSWVACAAVVGVLASRPLEVVVETRIVERVVEVPVPGEKEKAAPPVEPRVVAEVRAARPSVSAGDDLPVFSAGGRPWTLLSSRRDLFGDEPVVVADAAPSSAVEPMPVAPPASYADLRRELLPARSKEPAAAGVFRWF